MFAGVAGRPVELDGQLHEQLHDVELHDVRGWWVGNGRVGRWREVGGDTWGCGWVGGWEDAELRE